MKKKSEKKPETNPENLPGYEPYPENEDIYSKFKEEPVNLDELPADTEALKRGVKNIKPKSVPHADELDVPGAELDDDMEAVGNPDEENDYYSLGGDNHEDLEEDKA
jgi:hypothetical protein